MASENAVGWLQRLNTRSAKMIWLGPVTAAALLLVVAWIARPAIELLIYSDTVAQCDTMVHQWFRAQSTPQLDRFFYAFTMLGTPTAMVIYALGGVSFLMNRKQWALLYCWDTLFLGLIALTISLKHVFHRARPVGAEQFLTSNTFAFPSTHATSAVAAFGMIAYVLLTLVYRDRDQRVIVIIVATLVTVLMGLSRLYLGVHYLSDVVGGFAVGAFWLTVCLWSLNKFAPHAAVATKPQPTNK